MTKYGKLQGFEKKDNTVYLSYENGQMEIQVVTEQIIRFFSQIHPERMASKAIEEDKCQETEFEVKQSEAGIEISTEKLLVKVYEDGMTDIFDKEGNALCCDYRGERTLLQKYDQYAAELLEQEGHSVGQDANERKIQVVKQMDGDECFYGLGDKTGFLNKRGYEYECWNTDDPSPQMDNFKALYKSIPFFITLKKNAVYGLFFDNTFRTYFDMGKESDDYYWFGADQGNLDYYFIGGDSMMDIVRGYTYLTGTAPLPQLWTLGYHQSRWGYRSEEDIRYIAENMRKNDIPCDAVHMDIDYMEHYKVFTVNQERFPDLKKLTEDLADMGMRIVTIMDPGVKIEEGYKIYEEGIQNGYFARTPEGGVYENAVWPGDSVFPDFGRKEVRDWWGDNYKVLLDEGVAGIWTDMNEPASFKGELPADVVFYDEDRKSCHAEMHNVYGHNMAKATYNGLKKLTGKRPFVITRACYSGTQKYSIGWTGDNHSLWAHLQMAIPQMCNMGLSGMPFIGTDMGGFGSDSTKELMCRWVQVGAFSPFCRNHAAAGTRQQEPWQFGQEVVDIYKKYLGLRYQLLPYLYDLCKQEEEECIPMMRPLVLHYEKDENVKNLNGQFMLGESLMIAPVVEQGATQKLVYLPEGTWYDYWTREKLEGGRYIIREAGLDVCPVYVKAGSIIPMYPPRHTTMGEKDSQLILNLFPGEEESRYIHYQDNGEDFAYQDGQYNMYCFTMNPETEDKVKVELLHHGYDRVYEAVDVM